VVVVVAAVIWLALAVADEVAASRSSAGAGESGAA